MTEKANILSFDEVKARGAFAPRTVSSRRSSQSFQQSSSYHRTTTNSASMGSSGTRARGSRGMHSAPAHAATREVRGSRRSSSDYGVRGASRGGSGNYRAASGATYGNTSSSGGSRDARRSRSQTQENPYDSAYVARSERSRYRGAQMGYAEEFDRGFDYEMQQDQNYASDRVSSRDGGARNAQARSNARVEKESALQKLQKRFRSAKADREFDRTIGAQERKAQANQRAQQGSRAAVYEMRMGSTHRKSARMQDEGNEKGSGGFLLPFSLPFSGSLSAAATRGIVAMAVLAFTVFMLYPPCQSYYNETRQLQQLQAEYDALTAYNTQMQAQIDYLNTDEGLEDYARSELGWIREDEQVVTVEGVQSSVDGSTQTNDTSSPLNEEIPAPDTWYSGVLDVFFGYGS